MFIVQHLTGIPLLNKHIYPDPTPVPRNSTELYLIETMLDEVPDFRARFMTEMATATPKWAAVIAAYPELIDSLYAELARGFQLAPETSRKLNACLGL